ncbi:hypothetical protein K469DRAFT_697488 [Zopfia rhizophila CBS 207.26]|uniref:Heterokaryon incompatibility domain-containing protein n=1 Tax=Zopfia rhizophila CBS 207.26 TaxID=1314779 RepID=A0A6A6DCD6_9PEZI|nr:hypothetical protein K469DRAFT_697488 [Zopfia rhizophila CBS 207.26]
MEHLGLSILKGTFDVAYEGNEYRPGCTFHTFPADQGWDLDTSTYKLTPISGKQKTTFVKFMQSWLFFGLIATVVYDDNRRDFNFERLIPNESKIDTTKLSDILEEWQKWELDKRNFSGQKMRMIRAQLALDLARNVVRRYCSIENLVMDGTVQLFDYVYPNLALSLMVLGETLTTAKAKIISQVSFDVRGWYGDASIGWGTPQAVIDKMKKQNWCPRTIKLLTSQLRENATALLSVLLSHHDHEFEGHKTAKCDEDECKVKSSHPEYPDEYATKHHPKCLHNTSASYPCRPNESCRVSPRLREREKEHHGPTCHSPCHNMIGVNIEEVVGIIRDGRIPLIKFNKRLCRNDPIRLEVIGGTFSTEYATISHVWSDGYGNPDANKLWRCQLHYFWLLLTEAQAQTRTKHSQPLPFWIDTLTIPVDDKYKLERRTAIQQIYDVYSKAKYTIIIDNGLNSMPWSETDYTTTAMRILASGWMRRLWTLQEAYLSRKLLFAVKHVHPEKFPLVDLDEIEDLYIKSDEGLVSNLRVSARSYYHNMLGQDRKAKIHNLTSTNSIGLIASVWRAAQWRTTSHLEHETLALATLLNLDYQNKSVGTTELLKQEEDKKKKLDEKMIHFWELLEESSPGAIPPGIIFLPGDRIEERGFGWAPRSWMLAQGIDHPDPMSMISKPATLSPEKGGLLVEFPGFLLHCQDRDTMLRDTMLTDTKGQGIWFPSDNSLSEWYHLEWADDKRYSTKIGINHDYRHEDLAIILCRSRPREIAEIGLLVEIYKTRTQRELGKDHKQRIFAVYLLGRVNIRREMDDRKYPEEKMKLIQSQDPENHNLICGEALDEDQKWYVDCRTTLTDGATEDESSALSSSVSVANVTPEGRLRPIGMTTRADETAQSETEGGTSRADTEASGEGLGASTQTLAQTRQDDGATAPASEQEQRDSNEQELGTHQVSITSKVERRPTLVGKILGKITRPFTVHEG